MKTDRRQTCEQIADDYMETRSISSESSWEIWIPDFLDPTETDIKAFLRADSLLPVCDCDLGDESNSEKK